MSDQNGGTQSAQHLSAGEGRALWFATDLYIIKRASEDTNGAFTLYEVTGAPQSPPAPHIHHREDETYYILEGEFEFLDQDRTKVSWPPPPSTALKCLLRRLDNLLANYFGERSF